ncbi:hypothetical protein A152_0023195 [Vibrio tasmaniensis 1F-187]|nr:hypothetical protein [Vibrio tasmaniensis]OEF60545.1 hypothetical protein A152_08330 [Vibrio tasmaniensis 1F-187]
MISLSSDQKKWLGELETNNKVKDLGIYVRSLKHLNKFVSSNPQHQLNQQFVDDFLSVYLHCLVSSKKLRPSTAKAYYNLCFRFMTWLNQDTELKKADIRHTFSNVVDENSFKDLSSNTLFFEINTLNKCSIEFKLIFLITLREKQLKVEDIIALKVEELSLIYDNKLRKKLENYVKSNRRSSRLEKVRNELPDNMVFYSQRGELYSLDSFRSRLSDLNRILNNKNIHISSKKLRDFSINDEELCELIGGMINE